MVLDARGVLDRNGAWCPPIPTTAPNASHNWPYDCLELGRRVAARIGNENREQWGAWIPAGILWVNYAAVDEQLAYITARPFWSARRGPKPIPEQRRPVD